uniref:DNA/RNA non-specific endonuclease/pyrophosphatase/phosphodiesterase domain-containing protein n=1 Tax=Graphocephala atropunctata TaxID=36148 RepID=A0A1B6LJ00_9HEMI
MFVAILTLAVAVLVHKAQCRTASCKLSLKKNLDQKEPLILTCDNEDSFGWVMPEVEGEDEGVITLAPGEQLMLACPGKKNTVKANSNPTALIDCDEGTLKIDSAKIAKGGISCSKSVASSEIFVSEETCGCGADTGVIMQLGFQVEKVWLPLVEICHNTSRCTTLYAYHTLPGHSVKGSVKSSQRTSFKKGSNDLFQSISPDNLYTKKQQKVTFKKILGTNSYISSKSFLAKGHLSPDADFIYNSGQLLTYFYVNVAPQWQKFNAGNWLSIETTVRSLAAKVNDKLQVYTGTYGILTLKGKNRIEKKIYLEPTKKLIPVPEIYWKLVRHDATNTCTVVIGHNNVYLTSPPSPLCSPVYPSGWPELTNLEKGYTHYCDYNSFLEVVHYVPDLECDDLLEFPSS